MRTVVTLKLCYFLKHLVPSLVAKYFARHLAYSLTGTSARSSSFAHHTLIPATGEERCVTKQNDCAGMNKIFILLRMSDDLSKLKVTLLLSKKCAEDLIQL